MAGQRVKELRAQFEQFAQQQAANPAIASKGAGRTAPSTWSQRQQASRLASSESAAVLQQQLSAAQSGFTPLLRALETPSSSREHLFSQSLPHPAAAPTTAAALSQQNRAIRDQFERLVKQGSSSALAGPTDQGDERVAPVAIRGLLPRDKTGSFGSQASLAGRLPAVAAPELHLVTLAAAPSTPASPALRPEPSSLSAYDASTAASPASAVAAPRSAPAAIDPHLRMLTSSINETLSRIQERVARSRNASVASSTSPAQSAAAAARAATVREALATSLAQTNALLARSRSVTAASAAAPQRRQSSAAESPPARNFQPAPPPAAPTDNQRLASSASRQSSRRSMSISYHGERQPSLVPLQDAPAAEAPVELFGTNETAEGGSTSLHHTGSINSSLLTKPKRARRRTGSISEAAYLRRQSGTEASPVLNDILPESSVSASNPVAVEVVAMEVIAMEVVAMEAAGMEAAAGESIVGEPAPVEPAPVEPAEKEQPETLAVAKDEADAPRRSSGDNEPRQAIIDAYIESPTEATAAEVAPAPSPLKNPNRLSMRNLVQDALAHLPSAKSPLQQMSQALQKLQTRAKGASRSKPTSPLGSIDQMADPAKEAAIVAEPLVAAESPIVAVEPEVVPQEELPLAEKPLSFKDRLTTLLAKGPALPNQSLGGSLVTAENRETTLPSFPDVTRDEEENPALAFEIVHVDADEEPAVVSSEAAAVPQPAVEASPATDDADDAVDEPHGKGTVRKRFGDLKFVNKITLGLMRNTAPRQRAEPAATHVPLQSVFAPPTDSPAVEVSALPPLSVSAASFAETIDSLDDGQRPATLAPVTRAFQKPRRPGRSNSVTRPAEL